VPTGAVRSQDLTAPVFDRRRPVDKKQKAPFLWGKTALFEDFNEVYALLKLPIFKIYHTLRGRNTQKKHLS
jgi:hypothetical protein